MTPIKITLGARRNWILTWALLFVFVGAAFADPMPEVLIGTWRLTSVYPTHSVRGWYPNETRKLVGSMVIFKSSSLASCGQTIEVKSVSTSQITTNDLLELYHVTFANLGIKDETVLRVVINDNEDGDCLGSLTLPGEEVYLKNHDEVCINLDGVVFKSVRIRDARKPAAPHSAVRNQ